MLKLNLPAATQLLTLPLFTGSLKLRQNGGIKPVPCRLLSLPSGIRFRKLTLEWFDEEHLTSIARLVAEFLNTLESLDITCHALGKSIGHPLPH